MTEPMPVFNYMLAETDEKDERRVVAAPENWFTGGKLHWPIKGAISKRKKQTPPEDGWKKYDYKLLGEPFTSLHDALKKEKFYEQFSNSESEKEFLKRKLLKRKHPIVSDLIDANDLFDEIKTQETGVKNIDDLSSSLTPIVPLELLDNHYSNEAVNSSVSDLLANTVLFNSVPQHTPNIDFYDTDAGNKLDPCKYFNTLEPSKNTNDGQNTGRTMMQHPFPNNPNGIYSYRVYNTISAPSTPDLRSTTMSNQFPGQSNLFPVNQNCNNKYQLLEPRDNTSIGHNTAESKFPGSQLSSSSGRIEVLDIYPLETSIYSQPKENSDVFREVTGQNNYVTESAQICTFMNGNVKKDDNDSRINQREKKVIGKENRRASKSAKDISNKKGKKLGKPKKGKGKSKVAQKKKQTLNPKQINKSRQSTQEIGENQVSPLVGFINNFVTSPTHNVQCTTQDEYFPLLYNEFLEFKALYMADRIEMKRKVDNIEKVLENNSSSIHDVDRLFDDESVDIFDAKFSIKKKSEFRALEVKLRTDPIHKAKLESRFRTIGGNKARLMIRACMRYLVCDSVLMKYTWKGTTKKSPFKKLTNICNALFASVRSIFKKYTRKKFNMYLPQYLKFAGHRHRLKVNKDNNEENMTEECEDEETEEDEDSDEESEGGSEDQSESEEEDEDEDE